MQLCQDPQEQAGETYAPTLAQGRRLQTHIFRILSLEPTFLVCLIVKGINPTIEAELSISRLMCIDQDPHCNHRLYSPVEFATKVPDEISSNFSTETKIGWELFLAVLEYATEEWEQGMRLFGRNWSYRERSSNLPVGARALARLKDGLGFEMSCKRVVEPVFSWTSLGFNVPGLVLDLKSRR
jgi:hypothetical protein